jgi:hypothetical protein
LLCIDWRTCSALLRAQWSFATSFCSFAGAVAKTRATSILSAALLTTIALTACADRPVVTTVDTLCLVTTRYRASDAQVAAFKADRGLWEPLVDWRAAFNKERDKRCRRPAEGP